MLRLFKVVIFSVILLLAAAGRGNCAILPEFFWNWGGEKLLSLLQAKINGKITVKEIKGNPLSGLTYQDLTVTGPQGQVMLRVDRLELSLSALSIPSLHPIISRLALINPHAYLVQEAGGWNISRLALPEKPGAPSGASGATGFIFREVDFSNILVKNGEIDLTRGGATQRYTDLDLKSALSLLDWGTPQEKIDLKGAHLAVTAPQGRMQLDTSLIYSSRLARINSLDLKLAGQQILSLKGELCMPLESMTCKLTGQVGPVQGKTIQEFYSRWPAPWDLKGSFTFSSSPKGMKLAAAGSLGEAGFNVQGFLNAGGKPAVFTLDADLKGLATAQLQEIQGVNAQNLQGLSPVSAHLKVQGTGLPWSPEGLKADLNLEAFQYRQLTVQRLELNLAGTARSQDLHLAAAGNFGAVTIDASGHLLPLGKAGSGAAGDLNLKVKDFKPAPFGLSQYAGTELTGGLQGKFQLPPGYSPARTSLAGTLEARGRVLGEPLDQLQAKFSLAGEKLTLASADLRMASLAAHLKGTLSPAGIDLGFTTEISGSRGLPVSSPASFGQLTAQGTVKGPWRQLHLNVTANGKNFSFQGVSLQTASLCADLYGWPPASGSIQIQGTRLQSAAADFSRVALTARGEAGQWSFQVAATSLRERPRFNLAGSADLRGRPLTIQVSQVSWQSAALTVNNRAPFQVRLFPGYEITPATFQVDGGQVTVQGLVRANEVSGRLQVQNLQAKLLSPGLPAQGKISGNLVLAGTPRAPVISGSLALADGKLGGIPIQTLTTTLSYESGQLQVSGYLEESAQHSKLAWKGTVPVSFSLIPLKFVLGHQGLNLRVQSENVNLSILAAITSEVQSAQATVDLLVEAKGDPRQPQVSGYIRWGAGYVLLQEAGTSYQLASGEIRLQGDRITIPGIVLTSQGTFRLSGDLALTTPTSSLIAAQLNNFMVLNRGGNQLVCNGSVKVTGPLTALSATGRLTVPRAEFHPTFFRSPQDPDVVLVGRKTKTKAASAPSLYRNLQVEVSIEAPNNVWLKDRIGKAELTASLDATKKRGQSLVLGGTIRVLHGTVDIQDQEFKVERAIVTLPGAQGKPVLVDAKAIHALRDSDIILVLSVTGTVTNPQIRLESEPSLPPADVLSYLVFGAPTASISRDQYLALGVQTLGGLGGVTTKKLGDLLGSSLPFLSGIAFKTGPSALGVEKKITKNISVSYQRVVNQERGQYERQVEIDYKINRNWSIESQLGARNPGADVLFNYDF